MVHEFCGFTRSVLGSKKFPSDSTLNNMKKTDLIDLLHIAQHNFESLNWFYNNAVKYNENNIPIPRWIPCSERLPVCEEEVFVCTIRKYRDDIRFIITSAIYEDGTMLENDSSWRWEDIEGEWDEEEDCYIIPEGWWEDRHYNPDDVYNNLIDDEVIAWMPLPEPYKEEGGIR